MLEPEQFKRIEEIFESVIELPPSEREDHLEQSCKDNPHLLQQVRVLLDEDAVREIDAPTKGLVSHFDLPVRVPGLHALPERIGRYRIIKECGHGGMGTVYEAVQDSPERRVALKMIRPGMMSPQLMQRFRYETEFLGRLQHAGVGQIFEADVIDLGAGEQPYFVMEFVDGAPLLEHIRQEQLGTSQRLMLFVLVCDAVHHAHQRGVIHRDLKPENILVVPAEPESGGSSVGHYASMVGQPKVLDFGIARATDVDLQATMQTDAGALVGTLQYMSPEQAAGDSQCLDVRSDIYALGVILFEVLSDKTPYELKGKNIAESIQIIREHDPSRLSSIHSRFRGDLETIVGKCLEKEPEGRYASASDLAADVRRHLQDEPISARPPSTWYQLRKFSRRNRHLVLGVAATMLALAIGLIGTIVYAVRAGKSELNSQRQAYVGNISAASGLVMTDPHGARTHLERIPTAQREWEWNHLYSALNRHDMIYSASAPSKGHEIVVTPDGRHVVSALENNRLAVWEVDTGRLVRELPIEEGINVIAGPLFGLAKIAIGTSDHRTLIWDFSDQPPREVFEMSDQLVIHKLAWSHDSGTLAIGTSRRRGHGPDRQEGRIVFLRNEVITGEVAFREYEELMGMAFSPDGKKLIALMPGLTQIDVASCRKISSVTIDGGIGLAVSPTGIHAYVANEWRVINPVELKTMESTARYTGHQGAVHRIACSYDGTMLATSSGDNEIRLWNTSDGQTMAVIAIDSMTPVAFDPDSSQLFYRNGGKLRSWSLSIESSTVLSGHESFVYHTNWSNDGNILFSGERFDNHVIAWDPIAGRAIRKYTLPDLPASLYLRADKRQISVALPGGPATLDLVTGECRPHTDMRHQVLNGRFDTFDVIDASGKRFARGGHGGHDVVLGKLQQEEAGLFFSDHEIARLKGQYNGVAFSPDMRWLAAGGDPFIDVWEVESIEHVARLHGHKLAVYAVDFSPDGKRLASGSNDNTVRLWDTQSWEQVAELRGHTQYVMSVTFSPDGTQLASASGDHTVRIWDTVPRFERVRQAREFTKRMDRVLPRVNEMLTEYGDAGVAADHLKLEFADPDEYLASLRVMIKIFRDQSALCTD